MFAWHLGLLDEAFFKLPDKEVQSFICIRGDCQNEGINFWET
jgi:hypothetical protein